MCPEQKALHLTQQDVLIKAGTIAAIAPSLTLPPDTQQLALDNLHISTGWLDSGVSFGEPGFEERETLDQGLLVAAQSGFTDILLNPNTNPMPATGADIAFIKGKAQGKSTALHPLGCLTRNAEGQALAELFDMKQAGAVAFYDHKQPVANPNLLKTALLYVQHFGGLLFSFPEDKQIRGKGVAHEGEVATRLGLKGIPALAETLQVARDLTILEYTGGTLHIPTISTAASVALIAEAKAKGLEVSCSVAIHNLLFTEAALQEFDPYCKVSPPLRTSSDCTALIQAVKQGVVDFVTSDHLPIDIEQKRVVFDNAAEGTIGLESAFGSLLPLFGLEATVALLTKGHERFGLKAPVLREGEKACLTLFNPAPEFTFGKEHIASTSKNSMFLGAKMKGEVYGVINNGQMTL